MTENKKIVCDIIVPVWNKIEVTKSFVESIIANTLVPVRIIIVNNHSEDQTREYLQTVVDTEFCTFEIINNETNEGFIRAINKGLEISTAPYACFSNNDLLFSPGWLKEIIDVFQLYPEMGLLNPNSNGLVAPLPSGVSVEDFGKNLKERLHGQCIECSFCIGFCMVARREVVDKLGGLSLDYLPMFFEDTDYSMRVNQIGFRKGIALGSYVWHMEHASLNALSDKGGDVFQKSKLTYEKKWGKTSRVAFIFNDEKNIKLNFDFGIKIARRGDFVWFYVRNLSKDRESIFQEQGKMIFAGIGFVSYTFSVAVAFFALVKKKQFDCIFTDSRLVYLILRIFGKKVYFSHDSFDAECFSKEKLC